MHQDTLRTSEWENREAYRVAINLSYSNSQIFLCNFVYGDACDVGPARFTCQHMHDIVVRNLRFVISLVVS